jgi:TRAP-type C4-dicarboxylate transport system permease small subunit
MSAAAFFRAYDRVLDGSAYVAAAVIGVAALATVVDAGMRNFELGYGIAGIVELTEYGLAFVSIVGAAWALRARAHISVDIVLDILPPRARRVADRICQAAALAVSLALVVAGGLATLRSAEAGRLVAKTFTFPEWWLQILLPIGGVLLAIECARRLFGRHDQPAPPEDRAATHAK